MIGQLLDSQGRNNKIENTLTGLRITTYVVIILKYSCFSIGEAP